MGEVAPVELGRDRIEVTGRWIRPAAFEPAGDEHGDDDHYGGEQESGFHHPEGTGTGAAPAPPPLC